MIVIHEVWGLVEHTKALAERLAEAGFYALAPSLLDNSAFTEEELSGIQADLFDPQQPHDVQPQLRQLRKPSLEPVFAQKTVGSLVACFDYLYQLSELNHQVSVIGFCFGGTYAYALAAAEPRLKAAFPFYGHCDLEPGALKQIRCPIRAFYGQQDEKLMAELPIVRQEMTQAGVDFESTVYPGCGHAFFNDSNRFTYNRLAAEHAWQLVLDQLIA